MHDVLLIISVLSPSTKFHPVHGIPNPFLEWYHLERKKFEFILKLFYKFLTSIAIMVEQSSVIPESMPSKCISLLPVGLLISLKNLSRTNLTDVANLFAYCSKSVIWIISLSVHILMHFDGSVSVALVSLSSHTNHGSRPVGRSALWTQGRWAQKSNSCISPYREKLNRVLGTLGEKNASVVTQ